MDRIARLNAKQMTVKDSESWHADYKDSAYVYAGGLPYDLTEGDIVCIFSQYGEVLDINLVRDKKTGKSKGFAFLRYEDQRSTILAVDNFTGAEVLGRKLRVDHVNEYKQPKKTGENADDWDQDPRASMNVAPLALLTAEQRATVESSRQGSDGLPTDDALVPEEDYTKGLDPEDPMLDFLVQERRESAQRKSEQKGKKSDKDRRHKSNRVRSKSPRRGRVEGKERSRRAARSHSRSRDDRHEQERRRRRSRTREK